MKLITKTNKTLEEIIKEEPQNIVVLTHNLFTGFRITSYDNYKAQITDANKCTKIKADTIGEAIDVVNQFIKENQYLVVDYEK